MKIEQGVKVVEKGDKELVVNLDEYYVKGDSEIGYKVYQARKENTLQLIAITIDDDPSMAIKIAKRLNEDLKR